MWLEVLPEANVGDLKDPKELKQTQSTFNKAGKQDMARQPGQR